MLQGYYTIWNNDNHNASKVGFAPHDTSSKFEITTGTTPTTNVQDLLSERTLFIDLYLWFSTWLGKDLAMSICYIPGYLTSWFLARGFKF